MTKPSFILDAADERAFRQIRALLRRRFCYDSVLLKQQKRRLYEVVQVHDRCLQSLGRIRSYIEKGF